MNNLGINMLRCRIESVTFDMKSTPTPTVFFCTRNKTTPREGDRYLPHLPREVKWYRYSQSGRARPPVFATIKQIPASTTDVCRCSGTTATYVQ
jgi:hypothetical protein